MKVLGARAAADELARVLDGAPAGPATAPLAAVAARVTAARPSLDALTAPRAEFRDALRTRLVAVATVQAAAPTPLHQSGVAQALAWSRAATRRRGFGVAAGAMASVVAVAGVAVAGDRSLPGQPFYGVKRATENVQLRTADGPVEKGTRHLQFATERLDEVRALTRGRGSVALGGPGQLSAAGPDADLVVSTLADMDAETRTGSQLLLDAAEDDGSQAPLALLASWSSDQERGLAQVLPLLPGGARERAAESLALVGSVGDDAAALLGTAGPGALPTPTAVPTTPSSPGAEPGEPAASPTPEPTPAPSPSAPAATPRPTASPAGEASPSPAGGGATPSPKTGVVLPLPSLTVQLPSLPAVPLPSAVSLPPVERPSLPAVPSYSPLPIPLPSLPGVDPLVP